jgi:tetratricopeptide (TPR) repeat protein
MSRKERRAAAARGRQGGGRPDAAWIAATFAQAMRHHDLGEFLAADANCRAVLARDPRHVGCLHLMGTIAQQGGRFAEAESCFRTLAKERPEIALAHHGLGTALVALGRIEEAAAAYERSLAIKPIDPAMPMPNEPMTLLNLGYLYEQLGKPDRAAGLYERAVSRKPDFAEAHNNLGVLLLGQGKRKEASTVFARALALAPELFWKFTDVNSILVQINSGLGDAVRRAEAVWPSRPSTAEMLGRSAVGVIADDPLFRFVLESTPIIDIGIEKFLTAARAAILDRAAESSAGVDDDLLGFGCALARQCFINEYVYSDTLQEQQQVERLKQALMAALETGDAVPPLWIAAIASYGPLGALLDPQLALARRWPDPVDKVVTQQIREVQEERLLQKSIPRLTPISGETSQRVREQYEENPYPRWVLMPSDHPPMSINQFLAGEFPSAPFRPFDDRRGFDILIAGCGTGHHPIEMARRYKGARVLAVDLSLASLGYALRKTRELNVRNIDYGQADILELSSLGRTFDMVDASGVLHHLADPMEGWRRLCELTRPGGVMRIGLYSELGRSQVVAARRFIAERGFQPTTADIRRCRQELLSTPMRDLAKHHDFHSTSECRDLMFHVQEHRLSIPQIKEFLASQNLSLIGFELRGAVRELYREQYPEDRSLTDLDRWHAFEVGRPFTFIGMYQFWCQKV